MLVNVLLFEYSSSLDDVINKLENDYLKPNPDKLHLLLSEPGDEMTINIGNECISNSTNEKIPCVIFDNKLNFKINKSEKTDYECFHIFAI